jgi:methionyl-tRNA formyltransferase
MAGDDETGITLMRMDVGLDTGPIYVQEAIPIHADETAATLHDRLAVLGADLLAEHLEKIVAGEVPLRPQDESRATYAPLIKKEDGELDWHRSSLQLDRQIRALTPWPGAYSSWQAEHLKILDASPAPGVTSAAKTGQVFTDDQKIFVQTGNGSLQLSRLQLAGKKAMTAVAFTRGRPDFVGSLLGTQ